MCSQKSSKYREQLLKPYNGNIHPSRDDIMQLTTEYKKKHRKQLKKQIEAEQRKFDKHFDDRLNSVHLECAGKHHVSISSSHLSTNSTLISTLTNLQ